MFLVNLNQDYSKESRYISNTLIDGIKSSIKKGKKVILYINKRGEFSSLVCSKCNYIFKCKNCDISLNIHKYPETLICHLCSHKEAVAIKCSECSSSNLIKVGVGTQQIEKVINSLFKENIVYRFDSDNIKNKSKKKKALEELKKAEIIIGTKMITTGFDFKKVGLIGVLLIEQELMIAKYNTEEILFSNIKQVIGRGGRLGENTQTIIQTFVPENSIIKNIINNNYKDFFINTLEERKLFGYPPFVEMSILEYRSTSKEKGLSFMLNLLNKLEINNENKEYIDVPGGYDIQFSKNSFKKYNKYHYKIIIKGKNIRNFLKHIKLEVIKNPLLSIYFK